MSNPGLPEAERTRHVAALMDARRRIAAANGSGDAAARQAARADVDAAKIALGERGPVWWSDGTPDLNRRMARNTVYADWFAGL